MKGWAKTTDWQTLASLPACPAITCHFLSPTAFSLGQRLFSLVPTPILLWESTLRVWNAYTPAEYHCNQISLHETLTQIRVTSCGLRVEEHQYAHAPQKGFACLQESP